VSDIILAVTERQIAPGETACFPFAARTAYGIPSIHDFNVISDNPNFNPEWVRFRRSAGDSYGPHYILEITPVISGVLSMALIRSVYRGEKPGRTATPEANVRSS